MRALEVKASPAGVRFFTREWDGIDSPIYDDVETMTVDAALAFIVQIQNTINTVSAQQVEAKKKRKGDVHKEIERLQQELATL